MYAMQKSQLLAAVLRVCTGTFQTCCKYHTLPRTFHECQKTRNSVQSIRFSALACTRYIQNNTYPCFKICQHKKVSLEQRRLAGHSKWQNIRHIKAAKDEARARRTTKLVMGLRIAIKGTQSSCGHTK